MVRLFKRSNQPVSGRRTPRLSGSTQPTFRGYYSSPVVTAKIEQPDDNNFRRNNLQKAGLIIIGLVILSGVVWVRSPGVVIRGNSTYRSSSDYQKTLTNLTNGLLDHVRFTYDAQSTSNALLKQFPEIDSLRFRSGLLFKKPTYELTVATPKLLLRSGTHEFVVNAQGRAVASVAQLGQGSADLPILEDTSTFDYEVGKQALGSEQVKFITIVYSQLSAKGVSINELQLPSLPGELDVRISGTSYIVKFNMQGSAYLQTGSYLAVQHALEQGKQTQPTQYIDVRVDDRVFVK